MELLGDAVGPDEVDGPMLRGVADVGGPEEDRQRLQLVGAVGQGVEGVRVQAHAERGQVLQVLLCVRRQDQGDNQTPRLADLLDRELVQELDALVGLTEEPDEEGSMEVFQDAPVVIGDGIVMPAVHQEMVAPAKVTDVVPQRRDDHGDERKVRHAASCPQA
mmetsp:Transcript_115740/g.226998  ORF Transcript_115740/g.226998 Transcript_115740/m.226998 type:complete len:162 (-) Transcript_115740:497-982(-)